MKDDKANTVIYETDYMGDRVVLYECDGVAQSASFTDTDKHFELVFMYTRVMQEALEAKEICREVLLIGGAGYSLPKYLIAHDLNIKVDVVDIDAQAKEIAEKYFYLSELIDRFDSDHTRLCSIIADGRDYLEQGDKQYDVILFDAYQGVMPALDLLSEEALRTAKKRLCADGWYIANLPGYRDISGFPLTLDMIRTFASVFRYVEVMDVPTDHNGEEVNYILVASDEPLCFPNALDVKSYWGNIIRDEDLSLIQNAYMY